MKSLQQIYTIKAPIIKVWEALVDPKIIDQWGGGPAKMHQKEGDTFSLWGGDVHGTNIKVKPPTFLEQDWYGGEWGAPSKVTFTLTAQSVTSTKIVLIQDGIPDSDFEDIRDGWKQYYLGPLKELLEK